MVEGRRGLMRCERRRSHCGGGRRSNCYGGRRGSCYWWWMAEGYYDDDGGCAVRWRMCGDDQDEECKRPPLVRRLGGNRKATYTI
nr:hypothetical protein Itr_chr12CG11850 [Ipomoea trifida]